MTQRGPFGILADELDGWREAGRTARLWLRDDDAVEPTAALDRLLTLTRHYGVPVTLAIIPARAGESLAAHLEGAGHAFPAVHGWSHDNHAPPSEKKQELGPHRPRLAITGDLARARARLCELFGDRLVPLLVPPWNRIDPGLLPELPSLGFAALSGFGPEPDAAPLPIANTHVDLIDWRGGRRCRDHAALVEDLTGALRRRRGRPVGLLTHHLVHDENAWQFLAALFEATASHGNCRWLSPLEAIDSAAASPC